MAHKIREIKGLDDAVRDKMEADGILTVEQLLAQADSGPKKSALAKKLGIQGSQLTELINRADLMRLNGVGTEYANLLEECGVDSCRELQHRVPANLHAKISSVNTEKQITKRIPTLAQVEKWVAEAKDFAKQA